MTASKGYRDKVEAWRKERLAKLAAEDGWLNLVGRWDLNQGAASLGSAPDNNIVLPAGRARLGVIVVEGETASFTPADGGTPIRIVADRKSPPRFAACQFLFEIMLVGEGLSLRARDKDHPARRSPPAISSFDLDESWRITAQWVALDQPVESEVETMVGTINKLLVTHKAVFEHDGARYELLPSYGTPQSPQFVIRDQTAATETYQASRFVYGEEVGDGEIVLDFNKAINPPCAFTDFAVCPLPPAQNILPFRIPAGELRLRH